MANQTLAGRGQRSAPPPSHPSPPQATMPCDEVKLYSFDMTIQNINERLRHLRSRLLQAGDRAWGESPGNPSCADSGCDNGIVPLIELHFMELGTTLEDCHSLMSRIEQVI